MHLFTSFIYTLTVNFLSHPNIKENIGVIFLHIIFSFLSPFSSLTPFVWQHQRLKRCGWKPAPPVFTAPQLLLLYFQGIGRKLLNFLEISPTHSDHRAEGTASQGTGLLCLWKGKEAQGNRAEMSSERWQGRRGLRQDWHSDWARWEPQEGFEQKRGLWELHVDRTTLDAVLRLD